MISSSFLYVKDILNIDGSYKRNQFKRLVIKSQYFTVKSEIRHALKKFKYIFTNLYVTPYIDLPSTVNIFNRSKLNNLNLISKKDLEPKSFNRWRTEFQDFVIDNLYIKKLKP